MLKWLLCGLGLGHRKVDLLVVSGGNVRRTEKLPYDIEQYSFQMRCPRCGRDFWMKSFCEAQRRKTDA